jgi:DMSO/TMAO reductase YedYZ molybdopterin-dependent catalytic subunit
MMNQPGNRKEEEDKYAQQGLLPPGQSLTQKFPVLHYGKVPSVDLQKWDFHIWGEVEHEVRLTWGEFNLLPRTRLILDLHCVTRWSKFDTLWEGVAVRTLLDEGLLKPNPGARFVMQHADPDYTTNLPLEIILSENFLLATHFNGLPLTADHGYPLRGVIGVKRDQRSLKEVYLWKGAKWLRGLEFMAQDRPGFWEEAGYHNDADIWKEERFR